MLSRLVPLRTGARSSARWGCTTISRTVQIAESTKLKQLGFASDVHLFYQEYRIRDLPKRLVLREAQRL